MPVYYGNQLLNTEQFGSTQINTIYQGANLVQSYSPLIPIIPNGLIGFFDFSNPLTYNNTGSKLYTLTTPYQTNGNQTGSLDYAGGTPPTSSFITTDGTASVTSLYFSGVNTGNNFKSDFELANPLYPGQDAWTIVTAFKYTEVTVGGSAPGACPFANLNTIGEANCFIFRDSSQSNTSYLTIGNNIISGCDNFSLNLNQWYILQISIGGVDAPNGVTYNINNTLTGSVASTPGTACVEQWSFNRKLATTNSTQRGGKGYFGVSAIYDRGLSAAELTYNFNSLKNRYGL
jgi:hypothetical protein